MLAQIIQERKTQNNELFDIDNPINVKFITKYLQTEMEIFELRKASAEVHRDLVYFINNLKWTNPNISSEENISLLKKFNDKYDDTIRGNEEKGLKELKEDIWDKIKPKMDILCFLYDCHFDTNTSTNSYIPRIDLHKDNINKFTGICIEKKLVIEGVDYHKLTSYRSTTHF